MTQTKSARLRFLNRDSLILFAGLFLVVSLVVYFWWPLAAAVLRRINWGGTWWLQLDWLLIGIFAFTSLAIVSRANLKRDALIIFVGLCGGLVIEAWGTQTSLWVYYTAERPPLWIIPAWPIANLAIDRITRTLNHFIKKETTFKITYWITFISFMIMMIVFVAPTLDKFFTIFSLLICTICIFTPTNYRKATLTFVAGSGLGYFLELWGTTNHCWTYYTLQTPPLFAVLAHGMAAVAMWRSGILLKKVFKKKKL